MIIVRCGNGITMSVSHLRYTLCIVQQLPLQAGCWNKIPNIGCIIWDWHCLAGIQLPVSITRLILKAVICWSGTVGYRLKKWRSADLMDRWCLHGSNWVNIVCLPVPVFACLSVCLVCLLSAWLSVCLSVCLSSVCAHFVCLPISLYVLMLICLAENASVYLICLSICLIFCLYLYLRYHLCLSHTHISLQQANEPTYIQSIIHNRSCIPTTCVYVPPIQFCRTLWANQRTWSTTNLRPCLQSEPQFSCGHFGWSQW